MRKGMTVKLNIKKAFTAKSGGRREYPAGTLGDDENGIFCTYRPMTLTEVDEWYTSPNSKGMTSAGETKLPPTSVCVEVCAEDILLVRRARCTVQRGYGAPTGGMTEVEFSGGTITYIKSDMIIPA